jgi:hypothetical protein
MILRERGWSKMTFSQFVDAINVNGNFHKPNCAIHLLNAAVKSETKYDTASDLSKINNWLKSDFDGNLYRLAFNKGSNPEDFYEFNDEAFFMFVRTKLGDLERVRRSLAKTWNVMDYGDDELALFMSYQLTVIVGIPPQIASFAEFKHGVQDGLYRQLHNKLDEQKVILDATYAGVEKLGGQFDKITEEQVSVAYRSFAYSLLGDISSYTPDIYEAMVEDITDRLDNALLRAVLDRLPDDVIDELNDKADDLSVDANELVWERAREHGLDLIATAFDTMMRFKELYTAPSTKEADIVAEMRNWSDARLDAELLGVANTFEPVEYLEGNGLTNSNVIGFIAEQIRDRHFYDAETTCSVCRETVLNKTDDKAALYMDLVLTIKMGRIMCKFEEIRRRALEHGYSVYQKRQDVLALTAILADCEGYTPAQELLRLLESN